MLEEELSTNSRPFNESTTILNLNSTHKTSNNEGANMKKKTTTQKNEYKCAIKVNEWPEK